MPALKAYWKINLKKQSEKEVRYEQIRTQFFSRSGRHEKMIQFDALPIYNKDNKYSEIMLVDEIPEAQKKYLAQQVAEKIPAVLEVIRFADECI